MKHILFIDPLEKLVIKKDSTLLLAHTLQKQGHEVYLLFEKDFYILSHSKPALRAYEFKSSLVADDFYIERFTVEKEHIVDIDQNTVFHMRLDPPMDTRYIKYLWMIRHLKRYGIKTLNDPDGILLHNEKIASYLHSSHVPSFVGSSSFAYRKFCEDLIANGNEFVILKPVDLYQGIGVEKVSLSDMTQNIDVFRKKVKDTNGSIIAQPYMKKVETGETRTVFFAGQELGTITKIPPTGDFLANIAQGAKFHVIELDQETRKTCLYFCEEFAKVGLPWLAFDILDGKVNEVNVTCPGLLVEVSHAMKKNLALPIVEYFGE